MSVTIHEVTFQKRMPDGETPVFRAQCPCGYVDFDAHLDKLQSRAACHDIDWQEIPKPEAQKS